MKRFTLITLSIGLGVTAAVLLGGLLWHVVPVAAGVASTQTDILGPPNSGQFGTTVAALPNGNIVVADPLYDSGAITDAGAVYLYNGATRALISTLTGSTAGDQVGSGGMVMLENGNYVVLSPLWNNGAADHAGAATWVNGTTGITGVVTVTNSLVGSQTDDFVGANGVTALAHGNYVVLSPDWNNDAAESAGAATWGNGTSGITGVVSVTNSLVGGAASDRVGSGSVRALANGNYVVLSPLWDNGVVTDTGAATWGNGATGITGVVSVTNSLVGSMAGDQVGSDGVTALANGNYVVRSEYWDNGGAANAGAATWGNGTSGVSGVVTLTNSLVGSAADDRVGEDVTALANSNYVVYNGSWDNGVVTDTGAATWGNGTTGITGVVTVANSLVGSVAGDKVGWNVYALANGNYVVRSPYWNNGVVADVGAATWGDGTTGITGTVTLINSLVGGAANDQIGSNGVTALVNGNYVVCSPYWDNGSVANAGAATWGNGTSGITGVVTLTNSLVGSMTDDRVGGATALANGNYVVYSHYWNNGAVIDAGAVTWGNGTSGVTGVVSVTNSLVGGAANDQVGYFGAKPLANGNYVVPSHWWDNGGVANAGAATWGNGTSGATGVVSVTNSLVGGAAGDQVGYGGVTPLANGNYVVRSPYWDNGGVTDAGAVTWGDGTGGVTGTVTAGNSVRGAAVGGGSAMVFTYDYTNDQLVVGRPADNTVTLFRLFYRVFLPLVLRNAP